MINSLNSVRGKNFSPSQSSLDLLRSQHDVKVNGYLVSFPGAKQARREADHSPSSCAEVKSEPTYRTNVDPSYDSTRWKGPLCLLNVLVY